MVTLPRDRNACAALLAASDETETVSEIGQLLLQDHLEHSAGVAVHEGEGAFAPGSGDGHSLDRCPVRRRGHHHACEPRSSSGGVLGRYRRRRCRRPAGRVGRWRRQAAAGRFGHEPEAGEDAEGDKENQQEDDQGRRSASASGAWLQMWCRRIQPPNPSVQDPWRAAIPPGILGLAGLPPCHVPLARLSRVPLPPTDRSGPSSLDRLSPSYSGVPAGWITDAGNRLGSGWRGSRRRSGAGRGADRGAGQNSDFRSSSPRAMLIERTHFRSKLRPAAACRPERGFGASASASASRPVSNRPLVALDRRQWY